MEDSEEDETPLQICRVEYEQGDRLFMTRILSEPVAEDLHATSTISQKLVEGVRRASEMWKGLLTLPDCAKYKGDWGTRLQENPQLILHLVIMIQLTSRRILRD